MSWYLRYVPLCFAVAAFLGCGSEGDFDAPATSPAIDAGPVALRRLTTEQYKNSVHDVLGDHILVPGRLDPDERRSGLLEVGATFASMTPSGLEKYEAAALSIAKQALEVSHRANLMPCEPPSAASADDACTRRLLERVGRRLFRRALTEDEVADRIAIARTAAQASGDFYRGLELALSSLLVSPNFLFRVERAEPDPGDATRLRLTADSIASRLSFLLWNTTPDDELLDAAERGELLDRVTLSSQVERLATSPRAEVGLRALFSDLYDFRQFDDGLVEKDPTLFPTYTQAVAQDAKEQTLQTIVDHLGQGEDYRDLFTKRDPLDESITRAGLMSHVSLLSLHSHPGRTSATLRGKFVREVLLCQDIPAPPANIDFSIVENTAGELRTARERLAAHVANDACAGCHSLMDPVGLAFENFDSIGMFREQENGVTIDASGELDGVGYDGPVGAAEALRDHPLLGPCFVRTVFRYAVARDPVVDEQPLLDYLEDRFADSGFLLSDLVREIVLSDGFLTTSGSREAEAGGGEP